ncbi:hypothetical protein CQ040_16365 [Microbacterium sp. MYb54]|nr:hypothetical protein CQ032_15715 [Microbacterium sp. MYb43]PQZ74693.1 hypothetical protein CQ031_15060 [Microbacterium sp. MYb40]PRB18781.1 hypothetical protein CQ040_16365 [Microbacterium sp. MYb54]PRB23641.1 hypothetical protein CQ037_17165 [Microbacterium sp. MYb50]PRB63350.1 hypothetical protein CQ021_16740 [Microbacterium sp. MYb24]PRB71854.1 hypothetical protein CQ027_15480 [Microbacterium sp. MYb32]
MWTHATAYGGASVDHFRGVSEEIRTDVVTWGVRVSRWLAAIAMIPMSFMILMPALVRGGLYGSRDRRALVVALRHSPARGLGALLGILMVVVAVVCAAYLLVVMWAVESRSGVLLSVVTSLGVALPWVLLLWGVAGGVLLVLPILRSESASKSIGEETPEGDRWVIESLAARTAADGAAAFMLAARTLRAFPPGRVLAAGARTKNLREGYERLGFEVGEENRVYRVT